LIIRVGDKSTSSLEHNLDALASALETYPLLLLFLLLLFLITY
jgi:hypothetical protein